MRDAFSRFRWDELALEKVTEMVSRKTVSGGEVEVVQVYLKKGALVPRSAHPTERAIYLLQGAVRLVSDRQDVTLREGDVLVIPAELAYQAECLDDSFALVYGRAPAPSS